MPFWSLHPKQKNAFTFILSEKQWCYPHLADWPYAKSDTIWLQRCDINTTKRHIRTFSSWALSTLYQGATWHRQHSPTSCATHTRTYMPPVRATLMPPRSSGTTLLDRFKNIAENVPSLNPHIFTLQHFGLTEEVFEVRIAHEMDDLSMEANNEKQIALLTSPGTSSDVKATSHSY